MKSIDDQLGILRQGNALILPILHHRLEYADLVRRAVAELRPAAIAVELPDTLEVAVRQAVHRLPEISVVLYEDEEANPVYLPVDPADALVEAVRSGIEAELPVALVDLDVDYPLQNPEAFPDSYAMMRIGPRAYHEAYLAASAGEDVPDLDARREQGMAHRVQRMLRQHDTVLVVCGMGHASRLAAALVEPQPAPFARTRRDKVAVFNLHPDSLSEVLTAFPFLTAVYERRRHGLPPEPDEHAMRPPRQRAMGGGLSLIEGSNQPADDGWAGLTAAVDWVARRSHGDGDAEPHLCPLDRQIVHLKLLQRAAGRYRARAGDEVHRWQMSVVQKFSRNMALLERRLLPDFYQLLIAARGGVDENFCYELWELGEHYPWQRDGAGIPTIRVSAEELLLGTRRIQLRRRIPRRKQRMVRVPLRKRKREKHPGEWLEHFDPSGLCSYPPEDLVIEDYGQYLRKKGVQVVGEELARTEPFTTSILDGIDVRETLRHWHEGQIYVREDRKAAGGVGSVVIVFDEDTGDEERFPFHMTWLGEHDQESDMAFYSTGLLEHVVGPGINRCEYGGLMLSYPPLRLFDVWEDPDYAWTRSKPELLLAAAIDYSLDRHVVYVAAEPPRSALRTHAERQGRKIVYVPIGQLSPSSLKKIRVFHVLWGKDKRDVARDYVW